MRRFTSKLTASTHRTVLIYVNRACDVGVGSKCEILALSRCFPLCLQIQTLLDAVGTSHSANSGSELIHSITSSVFLITFFLRNDAVRGCLIFNNLSAPAAMPAPRKPPPPRNPPPPWKPPPP